MQLREEILCDKGTNERRDGASAGRVSREKEPIVFHPSAESRQKYREKKEINGGSDQGGNDQSSRMPTALM